MVLKHIQKGDFVVIGHTYKLLDNILYAKKNRVCVPTSSWTLRNQLFLWMLEFYLGFNGRL